MAKGTIFFLFILTIVATLLFGINIGKKLGVSQITKTSEQITITITSIPTSIITPTQPASPSAAMKKTIGVSTFSDRTCGFSFSYPGSYMKQNTTNALSTILADPDDPASLIAATCAKSIPRPPVSSDKIESIMLDKVAATLYHDQNQQDGSPRDEVIVKHPTNGMEIIIAGYGEIFRQALSSFKFVE